MLLMVSEGGQTEQMCTCACMLFLAVIEVQLSCTLRTPGEPRGAREPQPPTQGPWRAGVGSLEITVHGAFCTSAAPRGGLPCSPAVLAAAPTPPGDGRGGFDSPAGSCRRTFGAEHKLVPARRGQQLLVDQRKRSSPRRWLASGARTRWSFETAS